jgi:hypothetical protein
VPHSTLSPLPQSLGPPRSPTWACPSPHAALAPVLTMPSHPPAPHHAPPPQARAGPSGEGPQGPGPCLVWHPQQHLQLQAWRSLWPGA